ncbi:MAG TPA: hypothetical protein DCW29_21945 [Janthinobacterium sp.]|nr:hypothetical protein [Janthinobacterium sp.]
MYKYTLLYIEDNQANLELVQALLERRDDVSLLSAADGNQGLRLARAHGPDVILLDINLPDMNGMDLMRTLRADPATVHIPVMALSSNAFPRQIEKGSEAGFSRYMTKPFGFAEFTDALDALLRQAAQHRAATPAPGGALS